MWSRRAFGSSVAVIVCGCSVPTASTAASVRPIDLSAIPASAHEQAMGLAIAEARGNPAFPFGAVILRAADRHVMAIGVNKSAANPTFHGEIVAINDYVARHGNRGWDEAILYTTGEPCSMCMSAMVWAGMGGVVWGTSIEQLRQFGINQILIPATTVIGASAFYHAGFCSRQAFQVPTPCLTSEAPPDERGGSRYAQPTATAPHLDSTTMSWWAIPAAV